MKKLFTKFLLIALTLILVLATVFFLIQKKPKKLDASRVALVDVVGKNYLFRGNNPFVMKDGEAVFAYDELKSHFKKHGYKGADDFYMVSINLLDLDEYYEIKKEKNFFKEHPQKGSMKNISTISPALLFAGSTLNFITDGYNEDISETLNKIHEILLKQNDKPVLIYIHCNGGRDRTGFIIAAYRLLFKNMNLQEVNSRNVKEVVRNSEGFYEEAIGSYCKYLKREQKKSDDFCIQQKD
jgi:hypothetical protein